MPEEVKVVGRPFQEGNPGRPVGATNKLTRTVKETVLAVFNEIQDDPKVKLLQFAKDYPRDFYALAAKLIPTEVKTEISATEGVQIIINRDPGCKPLGTDPDAEEKH